MLRLRASLSGGNCQIGSNRLDTIAPVATATVGQDTHRFASVSRGWNRTPQPEQVCDVWAGSPPMTTRQASAVQRNGRLAITVPGDDGSGQAWIEIAAV